VTAQVIPFPVRRPQATREQTNERLQQALAALSAAVENQRISVATWRGALADLSKVVSGLGDSLQRYRGNLDGLAARVGALHTQAVQLDRTADAALTASRK
jgi:ABC-type transporter Mla subunit MlaD